MLTVILEATRDEVLKYLDSYVPGAAIESAGRLTAIQSPHFERLGVQGIREIADAYGLSIVKIVDKPPFSNSVTASPLALPPSSSRG